MNELLIIIQIIITYYAIKAIWTDKPLTRGEQLFSDNKIERNK